MRRELFKLLTSLSHGLVVLFFIGVVGSVLRLGPLRDEPDMLSLGVMIITTVAAIVLALLVQWVAFLISPADFEDYTMAQRGRPRI